MLSLDSDEAINRYFGRRTGVYTALILLAAMLSAGCSRVLEGGREDRSFMTGQPCSPPCWYGLYLNESGEQEVRATLAELEFVDQSTIREWGAVWLDDTAATEIHWSCSIPRINQCGGALLSGGKLKLIRMAVGFELPMTDVVETHGQPEYVDYGPFGTEVMGCSISFYWPEKSMVVQSTYKKDFAKCQELEESGKLNPRLLATGVLYYPEDRFDSEPCGSCTRIEWAGFEE